MAKSVKSCKANGVTPVAETSEGVCYNTVTKESLTRMKLQNKEWPSATEFNESNKKTLNKTLSPKQRGNKTDK